MKLTNRDFESLAANRLAKEYAKSGSRAVLYMFLALVAFLVVDTLKAGDLVRFIFGIGFAASVVYYIRVLILFKRKCAKGAESLKILVMGEGVTVE